MADKEEVSDKIDAYLKKNDKGAKDATGHDAIVAIKKLMNIAWDSEDYLNGIALGCIAEIMESKDKMGKEFLKQLHEQSKTIGENVIKMYMTNNDVDSLPPR